MKTVGKCMNTVAKSLVPSYIPFHLPVSITTVRSGDAIWSVRSVSNRTARSKLVQIERSRSQGCTVTRGSPALNHLLFDPCFLFILAWTWAWLPRFAFCTTHSLTLRTPLLVLILIDSQLISKST
jgi:hypothetical protein